MNLKLDVLCARMVRWLFGRKITDDAQQIGYTEDGDASQMRHEQGETSMALVRIFRGMVPALFAFALCVGTASAQSNKSGCALEPIGGTSRQLLRCQGGLTIIAESGARYTLTDRNRDGKADAARLQSKALLLDFAQGSSGTGFQVSTPQAIAAVRGTKWAVDVASGKTSVFVVRGQVTVRRPVASAGVLLGPGQGVDVDQGTGALTVKRWPAARVSALMARFGQ